jgi:hypothetical protein
MAGMVSSVNRRRIRAIRSCLGLGVGSGFGRAGSAQPGAETPPDGEGHEGAGQQPSGRSAGEPVVDVVPGAVGQGDAAGVQPIHEGDRDSGLLPGGGPCGGRQRAVVQMAQDSAAAVPGDVGGQCLAVFLGFDSVKVGVAPLVELQQARVAEGQQPDRHQQFPQELGCWKAAGRRVLRG